MLIIMVNTNANTSIGTTNSIIVKSNIGVNIPTNDNDNMEISTNLNCLGALLVLSNTKIKINTNSHLNVRLNTIVSMYTNSNIKNITIPL